ncbi:hypothetical protein VNO77_27678 [Canavalia gladiata]|uniref:Uncharacterized protein n=1 Tax=Canavalia gladiata TaxID=3824 RepID=A0AAN9Q4C2_CANGL
MDGIPLEENKKEEKRQLQSEEKRGGKGNSRSLQLKDGYNIAKRSTTRGRGFDFTSFNRSSGSVPEQDSRGLCCGRSVIRRMKQSKSCVFPEQASGFHEKEESVIFRARPETTFRKNSSRLTPSQDLDLDVGEIQALGERVDDHNYYHHEISDLEPMDLEDDILLHFGMKS